MSAAPSETLAGLHGALLDAALGRRWTTATESVALDTRRGGRCSSRPTRIT